MCVLVLPLPQQRTACSARRLRLSCAAAAKPAAPQPAKGFGSAKTAPPARSPAALGCPCCSGLALDACCRPLIQGGLAPTAEAVLRARFSAYSLGTPAAADFIVATTHSRSPDLEQRGASVSASAPASEAELAAARAKLREDALRTSQNLAFKKLTVLKSEQGGNALEFWCTYRASFCERAKELRGDKSQETVSQRARFLQDSVSKEWRFFSASGEGLGSYTEDEEP
jgi:uncharacterized protein YchJ